ncbi:MAG TPA: hypothetical protein VFI08_08545 [Spirochaetia bacterium]|nr:hypothetical protein [Spirochaetia bacterium]
MRRACLAIVGLSLFLAPLAAQQAGVDDNTVIDSILAQKAISWENAAWLVGRATDSIDDTSTPADAVQRAVTAGWGPASRAAEAPLDLKSYSFTLVKALGLPHGLLFRFFPGPRYALRELVFRKIVPVTLAPDQPVSGEEAMRYLQAAQDWKAAHP